MTQEAKDRWEDFNFIIDDESLDMKEKCLLLVIFRYVNSKTRFASPSRSLIKKLTRISDNRTLDKMFNSLIQKGYLVRESGIGIRSKYFIQLGGKITPSVKNAPSGIITESRSNLCKKVGVEITPQKEKEKKIKENIYMDLKFIDEIIDKVKITKEQYEKLINKFNKAIVHKNIIAMDNYIANGKGGKYKDHYRALNTWCSKENKFNNIGSQEDRAKYIL